MFVKSGIVNFLRRFWLGVWQFGMLRAQNCGMISRGSIPFLAIVLASAWAPSAFSAAVPNSAEAIDINRATIAELRTIPGLTESWVVRIVRFRPYRSKLDLVDQGVVTSEVYQRIRDRVVAHRVTLKNAKEENRH